MTGRPVKATEAAPLLNKTTNAVKLLLWKMANDAQIDVIGDGLYVAKRKLEKPRGDGNDGNDGNRPVSNAGDDEKPQGNRDESVKTPWD